MKRIESRKWKNSKLSYDFYFFEDFKFMFWNFLVDVVVDFYGIREELYLGSF